MAQDEAAARLLALRNGGLGSSNKKSDDNNGMAR
jgi:hypothetical protein